MRRTLVPQRALALNNQSRTFATLPVELDPQTASLTVRIPRPTTANPLAWGSTGRLRVRIVVDCDGVIHTCQGSTRGGVVTDNRRGREGTEATEYSLTWNLPTGFFQKGNEPREQWASFRNKRWGETSKTPLRAWVELDRTAGAIASQVELVADVEPAPAQEYHSSVAYQNAASALEAASGDMAVSVSFDAGAGTDRVAFVFGSTSRDTRPTGAAVTYDGSISSDLGDVTNTYWRGAGGLAWDSLIGSGAKTVGFTGSGGSGSIYESYVGVISVTGAHQTTHGTAATNGADTGTALTCNLPSSPASDSLAVAAWTYVVFGGSAGTTGADQTVRTSQGSAQPRGYWETQPGTAGTALTHTKAASDYEWVAMSIELKAAGGGGTTTRRYSLSLTGVG